MIESHRMEREENAGSLLVETNEDKWPGQRGWMGLVLFLSAGKPTTTSDANCRLLLTKFKVQVWLRIEQSSAQCCF